MEQMNDQWFWAAVIGFVIGAFVVWLFMRSGNSKRNEDFASLEKEYKQYRDEVNAHFAKTADAVDNLTKSYQDVFTHLSDGAEHLMDKKALQAQLEKRQGKAVTLAYLVDEKNEKNTKSTKIEQDSVVEHQADIDKSSKVEQKDNAGHTRSGADEKAPAKKATEAVRESVTGQSVAVEANKSAEKAKSTKDHDQQSQSSQKIQAESVRTTVNTTNQPASSSKGHANTQQKIQPESSTETVNTTNQPATTKTSSTKQHQPAQNDSTSAGTKDKTSAQEAAVKAGLKPGSPMEESNNSESAIDSVKRHLHDNNKQS